MKPHLPLLLRKYLLIAFASLSINAAFAADWVNGSAIDLTNEPYRLFDEPYKHLIGGFTFTTYNDVEQSSLWTQSASLTQNKDYSSEVIVNGSWQLSRYPSNHTTITVNGNLTFNGSLSITYTAELNAGGTLTFNIDQKLNDKLSIEADKLVVGNGAALDIAKATALKLNSNDRIIVKENATLTISDKDVAYDVCLQGANLTVNAVYDKQIKSTAASIVEIGNNVELKAVQLDASAADVTLIGKGVCAMESGANTLGTGVSVANGWSGTVKTNGSTTALALDTLGVSGSKVELGSDAHTLAARDQSVAADLSSTGSVSLEGKELTLSGSNTLGSLSVGTLKIAGGGTALTGGLTTTGESSVADGANLSIDGETSIGGKITLGSGSRLVLDGTIMVDKDTFAPEDAVETVEGYFIGRATKPNSTQSGFKAACWDITIAEGGSITDNGATWQLSGDADADFIFETDGTLHAYGSDVDSVFHVAAGDIITYASTNASDFVNRKGTEATAISLNGGTLVLNTALRNTDDDYVKSAAASTINIGADTELNAAQLDASAADVTLIGSGTYNLESGMELGAGVKLSSDTWTGTVRTGAVAAGTGNIDVNHLGTAQSSVQLGQRGDVSVGSLAAERIGTVKTPGALTLLGQTGTANNLEVQGMLTLGTAECATRLTANGELSTRGIKLGNIGSSAYAAKLNDTALNLMIADSELLKLTGGSTTVLTLGSSYNGETSLNGEQEVLGSNGKMIYSLAWQNSLSRATSGTTLLLTANTNPTYVQDKVAETIGSGSRNGKAGCTILNDAYATQNPQYNTPESNLADLIDTVDAGLMTDCNLAAVSGASVTVLGQSFSGDIERQLRAIRNRAEAGNDGTICSITDEKSGPVSTMSPTRFFAWVNAEGNRAEQDADGTAAGYTMNSWGGTMGVGMTLNNQLTMGLALTAMYGNLESDAADYLDGDMDTYYLSAFARYNQGAWNHSFIGTVGTMESDYRRIVNHSAGSYQTVGDTEGTAFGLMYELSRDFVLNSKSSLSPVFNISYRHTEVDGYSESGSDAALSVGEQSLDTVTAGLGARYAAAVGQTAFNRTCAAEARVLVKYDMGDTQTDCSVGFIDHASRARIESAELGAWGVELGAGISVPVGYGSIFADGSVELRNDYTNMNATVGYRIQF